MKIIIPVAGRGTRVQPHTFSKPKPLFKIANKPAICHIIDKLKVLDIEEIILIVKDELEAIAKKSINDLDEDIFFKSRFLDSLNMLNLIIFIECRFNIRLESFFIDREKVSSINKITDYIEKELTQR